MSASPISTYSNSFSTYIIPPPNLGQGRQIKKISLSDGLKSIPVLVGKVILRIIVVATAIILSPLLAFAWGIANVSYAISKKSEFRKDLVAARETMKQTEEKRKFEALRGFYLSLIEEFCKESKPKKHVRIIKEALNNPQNADSSTRKDVEEVKKALEEVLFDPEKIQIDLHVKREKLRREIIRAEVRNGKQLSDIANEEVNDFCCSLDESAFATASDLKGAFEKAGKQGLSEGAYQKIIQELNPTDTCAAELSVIIKKILTLLESPSKDIPKTNRLITKYLREALETRTYNALKEDNSRPVIIFLHALAASLWTQTEVFDAYEELGNVCLDTTRYPLSGEHPIHEHLFASHDKASQKLLTDHGLKAKLFYALTHPRQALSSLASEGGLPREIAASFGFGTYDSHGQLSNNPSLQGTTSVSISTDFISSLPQYLTGKVLNCYGGSPTQGDHKIAPEFRAVCQAAENNLCLPQSKREGITPDMVYYTNLQHIEGQHGEGDRSYTIMSLAYEFPLSFRGMTLAKDSEFYMMRKNRHTLEWDVDQFAADFLTKLQHEACYTFEGRQGTVEGHGIYLPGTKESWQPVLTIIFDQARKRFADLKAEKGEPAYKLRGAFIEYVYSMIQAYMEVNLLIEAKKIVHGRPLLMTVTACKENIDRGGMENTKKLYTRLSAYIPEEERIPLIAGAMHGRALAARNRVILAARMPQILAFIEHIKAGAFQADLKEALEKMEIFLHDFTLEPAVNS